MIALGTESFAFGVLGLGFGLARDAWRAVASRVAACLAVDHFALSPDLASLRGREHVGLEDGHRHGADSPPVAPAGQVA